MTVVQYNPTSLASIMRAMFTLLLDDVPKDVPGDTAFIRTQATVSRLRAMIQGVYDEQDGSLKKHVEIALLARVVMGLVAENVPVETILAQPPKELLRQARMIERAN